MMATTITIYHTNTDKETVNKCCFNMSPKTAILHHNLHISSMRISGIYQIQSKIKPERCYIGSAVNIAHRKRIHLSDLRLNKHHSPKLQRHYDKYGIDDLVFSIVEPCLPQFLTIRENTYFNLLPYFNCSPVAGSSLGIKRSEETKQRVRAANLGKKLSAETIEKIKKSLTGKKQEIWVIEKKKKAMQGHLISKETKTKISQSLIGNIPYNKGKKASGELKAKLSQSHLGHKHSSVTKAKMSLSHKGQGLGRHLSDEHKIKLSKAHKGKPSPMRGHQLSIDTKNKLSESLKGRSAWNKGKKLKPLSFEHKKKISIGGKGKKHKKFSNETKLKMSKARIGKTPWNKGLKKTA